MSVYFDYMRHGIHTASLIRLMSADARSWLLAGVTMVVPEGTVALLTNYKRH